MNILYFTQLPLTCPSFDLMFANINLLYQWPFSRYFFPTMENDGLLCFQLDGEDPNAEDEIQGLENVVPEDIPDVHK